MTTYRTKKELNRYRREASSSDSSQPRRVRGRKYAPMTAERFNAIKAKIERRREEIKAELAEVQQ